MSAAMSGAATTQPVRAVSAVARRLGDYPVYRIAPTDSNRFAIVSDPVSDGVRFITVIEIFDVGGATPPNTHRAADELFLVLHGEGRAHCDGREFAVRTGDSFLVRAGAEHVVVNTGTTRLYCLTTMVPDEDFAALNRRGNPEQLDDEDRRVLART